MEKYAPYTTSVLLRISPYTVTEIYDRNTEPGKTTTYGRIRSVYSRYTVVYGTVYDRIPYRIRAFTSVYGLRIRRPGKLFRSNLNHLKSKLSNVCLKCLCKTFKCFLNRNVCFKICMMPSFQIFSKKIV